MQESSNLPRNAHEYRKWFREQYPTIVYGECACSPDCKEQTRLARRTNTRQLCFKGEPVRFINGHHVTRQLRPGLPNTPEEYREWFKEYYPGIPYGICACGCGRNTSLATRTHVRKKDLCFEGEPVRYIYGHARLKSKGIKYEVDSNTGCWVWQRGAKGGYGEFWDQGTMRGAHVVVYELQHGPVPAGKSLHHVCVEKGYGTTLCCNPTHLEPVTTAENIQRGGCAKLTPVLVREIRAIYAKGGHTMRSLGRKYGVGSNTICSAINHRTWRNI